MENNSTPILHRSTTPSVIFEDEDLLVVDKPGNLVCHSAQRPGQASLADWVRERGVTPRFVNRLDRETSGLVMVTKNERAAKIVGKQVLRREVQKEYIAICWGAFEQDTGRIDQAIALTKDSLVYTKRVVDAAGQASVTEFEVVKRLNGFTVVRLKPHTGRTHQLRVHMNWLGHPIVGDKVYGPDERLYLEFIEKGVTDEMLKKLLMPRHALHAARLACRHPSSQEWVSFEAVLPEDMMNFIEEHE
jgi:23S rRNA pseudouridine1911/1915/1917 synthase